MRCTFAGSEKDLSNYNHPGKYFPGRHYPAPAILAEQYGFIKTGTDQGKNKFRC